MKFCDAYHKEKHIVIDFTEEELICLIKHLEVGLISKCAIDSKIESITKSLKSFIGKGSNAKESK